MLTNREEKYFDLLLSEKAQADTAITGYADLHVKLFGLLGAGVVLLGWLYAGSRPLVRPASEPSAVEQRQSVQNRPHTDEPLGDGIAMVCLALAVISCGIVVHGVSTYALTLGYIQYKNEVLNPEFRKLLETERLPLRAVATWRDGDARRVTLVSSVFISILHKVVVVVLLLAATYNFPRNCWTIAAVIIGWAVVAATLSIEYVSLQSIRRVLLHPAD
ncbi:MAG TPA: hypothetical protein VM076_21890 [Gemmatimonadaceae bacterium]|nr:hypothetical protein [Gemmatimonadaceae bacterium]